MASGEKDVVAMGVADVVMVVAVLAVAAVGARRLWGAARGTRDCCSGASRDAAPVRAPRPADTDPAHYPYETTLRVTGMTCEGCAARVAAALDGLGGTWAEVDLAAGTARVRSKDPLDASAARAAVEAAGYGLA